MKIDRIMEKLMRTLTINNYEVIDENKARYVKNVGFDDELEDLEIYLLQINDENFSIKNEKTCELCECDSVLWCNLGLIERYMLIARFIMEFSE